MNCTSYEGRCFRSNFSIRSTWGFEVTYVVSVHEIKFIQQKTYNIVRPRPNGPATSGICSQPDIANSWGFQPGMVWESVCAPNPLYRDKCVITKWYTHVIYWMHVFILWFPSIFVQVRGILPKVSKSFTGVCTQGHKGRFEKLRITTSCIHFHVVPGRWQRVLRKTSPTETSQLYIWQPIELPGSNETYNQSRLSWVGP